MDEIANLLSIFFRFGILRKHSSDNETEFVNKVVKYINKTLLILHYKTASYNPRSNGIAEQLVKIAKIAIKKFLHFTKLKYKNWKHISCS
jgi:hypothetical protein